jgi:tetratricopeptide (TPR) repeat protein
VYQGQGKFDQAEALLVELVERRRRVRGPEHPDLALALALLGAGRLQQQRSAEAEPVLREALAIREAKVPDAWLTSDARWLLGGALLGQQKYAEAEPLLLQGYEGLMQRRDKIPAARRRRPTESLERLVQLYDAWGKPDEAAKWRKVLKAN